MLDMWDSRLDWVATKGPSGNISSFTIMDFAHLQLQLHDIPIMNFIRVLPIVALSARESTKYLFPGRKSLREKGKPVPNIDPWMLRFSGSGSIQPHYYSNGSSMSRVRDRWKLVL